MSGKQESRLISPSPRPEEAQNPVENKMGKPIIILEASKCRAQRMTLWAQSMMNRLGLLQRATAEPFTEKGGKA